MLPEAANKQENKQIGEQANNQTPEHANKQTTTMTDRLRDCIKAERQTRKKNDCTTQTIKQPDERETS